MACITVSPVVNRIETELSGKLQIIRLNVHDPVGERLGKLLDFHFTPTFIFFDGNGIEQWRSVGTLDTEQLLESLRPQ